jgi:DNA-binding FrmR family transcriptional regulator
MTPMGKERTAILNRLNRIEGQVRGIRQMITDDRYCIDILHQVQAVRAALRTTQPAAYRKRSRRATPPSSVRNSAN